MKKKRISRIVMQWLLICVLSTFTISAVISYIANSHIAKKNTLHLLSNSIEDALDELKEKDEKSTKTTLDNVCKIVEGGEFWEHINPERLTEVCYSRNIQEIHVIDSSGFVIYSSNLDVIDYDMRSAEQSSDFLALLDEGGPMYYYQDVRQRGIDNVKFRYIGRRLAKHKGFLQIGFDEDHYYQSVVNGLLEGCTHHRRIGDSGSIYIIDSKGSIVSAPKFFEGTDIKQTGLDLNLINEQATNTLFTADVLGESSYCMCTKYNGRYTIIAVQPISEATVKRDTALAASTTFVFAIFMLLFGLIYWLMKKLVVRNIERVNHSLSNISDGNLDEVINVRNSLEFDSLSNDINTTVDRLKDFIHEAETRLDADLALAKAIQMAALPNVFPAFPERKEFDLHACTEPAKEVGGDFYDFYFVGENKIAICIADVSGKGIPAAMFMMRGKSTLKNRASSGILLSEVFDSSNNTLCKNNETNTFITAWMAVINIKTGEMQYVNAGHNPPLLRHADGLYEFIEDKAPCLPLCAIEGIPYRVNTMTLRPGDSLYLYTDGVSEAENVQNEQYGDKRLLDTLNNLPMQAVLSPKLTCESIMRSVKDFAKDAEQSDDITMLAFRFANEH